MRCTTCKTDRTTGYRYNHKWYCDECYEAQYRVNSRCEFRNAEEIKAIAHHDMEKFKRGYKRNKRPNYVGALGGSNGW